MLDTSKHLKKINSEAKKKTTENEKKEQEEINKHSKQQKLM